MRFYVFLIVLMFGVIQGLSESSHTVHKYDDKTKSFLNIEEITPDEPPHSFLEIAIDPLSPKKFFIQKAEQYFTHTAQNVRGNLTIPPKVALSRPHRNSAYVTELEDNGIYYMPPIDGYENEITFYIMPDLTGKKDGKSDKIVCDYWAVQIHRFYSEQQPITVTINRNAAEIFLSRNQPLVDISSTGLTSSEFASLHGEEKTHVQINNALKVKFHAYLKNTTGLPVIETTFDNLGNFIYSGYLGQDSFAEDFGWLQRSIFDRPNSLHLAIFDELINTHKLIRSEHWALLGYESQGWWNPKIAPNSLIPYDIYLTRKDSEKDQSPAKAIVISAHQPSKPQNCLTALILLHEGVKLAFEENQKSQAASSGLSSAIPLGSSHTDSGTKTVQASQTLIPSSPEPSTNLFFRVFRNIRNSFRNIRI